ncbi:MAG: 4-hydroxy-3-methylbut-2-enyl diphosphate reductase [Clostridia bacterium]|nr:4-hydroxy-3-methylbut-2-enyl diphosphate reductase [Clostridia bacterium]
MEIIIGKTAGFCFGVANAVNKTDKLLDENNNICCLGELVHNKQVTEELEKKGLKFIDSISQAKKDVIIRAHGEKKETYFKAKEMGVNVIDLTCPKVTKIHKIAEEYVSKGYYILLVGNKNHPETIGTISYCGDNSYIIEDEDDVKEALQDLYKSKIKNAIVLAQTTFSLDKFNKITGQIKNNLEEDIELELKRTICDATKLRQEETRKISLQVDMMIILGGKHSSNTNKLYEIAKMSCKDSILIETHEELDLKKLEKYRKIGIMAGASTPQKSIDSLVEMLKQLC